ncbi:MAG: TatD family hydrolase [Geminicoccaceae bacterium]|nr:TatD family hydrolase [Geminicoccaceae bacterium]MDW8371256.1 TatD family hydrolase [Geminicoccaceae bacterium]
MIVDSHCHLDYPGLAEREAEVVANARTAGLVGMVTIGTTRAGWARTIAIAERWPEVWAAVGIHPHHAGEEGLEEPGPLVEAARHPKVVAIGESGLDFYYDRAPRDAQERSFRTHIEACRITGLPLVVHTRDADEATIAILEEEMAKGPFTGVIHCFSSSRALAQRALAMGLHLGIGGILTFKRSEELRAIVQDVPLERCLLETDAPYLAPVPHRGKTNEPAFTVHTAKMLAEVKGVPSAEVERVTTAAFFALFAKARLLARAA